MRIKLKKYKFIILLVCLVAGVSMTGWALAFHYDNKAKSAEFKKELKNDNQIVNAMPSALDHTNIILVLLCTGLVGFFGVRRHSKTLENFVKIKPPDRMGRG
jgi:hypothetical protein